MRIKLQRTNIRKLEAKSTRYEVSDSEIPSMRLRITPNGVKTFILLYRNAEGRQRRYTIGRLGDLTPEKARSVAEIKLAEIKLGGDPATEKKQIRKQAEKEKLSRLDDFLKQKYEPWATARLRSGASTVKRIRSAFSHYLDTPLSEIGPWSIEKWRMSRIDEGRAVGTINRDLAALRSCMAKAVDWEIISQHPLKKVKLLEEDNRSKVRYLTPSEEKRLREALTERDLKLTKERESANQWRKERGRDLLPSIQTDHLTPMVILSINTGLRRGELFQLRWEDVDLKKGTITIHGKQAKSKQTRHMPLNIEALAVLEKWKKQNGKRDGLVFPGRGGRPFDNCNKSWKSLLDRAGICNFRWHDMRHHFASQLVMADVSLNTVRDLLGHADLKMTLRYAHLAPEHKAAAVAKLVPRASK
ncbi:MAG: site-specific integrase [Candidatus Thiodiazotropha lotti]|uniref:Site-specific integrase n=1 Tax=Candidatus Thiodiazotropha lotti TaxID=2792787 RepID=A0A9E4K1L5_9GAMM|nr:site-specific integrase [Candidatus Thiodiazotropha lotti]MCG7937962.1 site-specific integrase [Candidatus Thiodiazotropha lotti]MCW4202430.1 site-specific integrase [Candidatus Thiodiazotropha lotti]MCW4222600.1 site-specific integrase [Candidatus Thiodiazotropha lotti]